MGFVRRVSLLSGLLQKGEYSPGKKEKEKSDGYVAATASHCVIGDWGMVQIGVLLIVTKQGGVYVRTAQAQAT